MGDHIVRRGAGSSRRSEPRPTAELSKQQLHGLIREQDDAPLEPELQLAAEAPLTLPSASSPRMLAHTLRRARASDALAPAARGSTSDVGRGGGIDRSDISTIEMPRVERSAATDLAPDPDEFRYAASDEDPTRLMRHRVEPSDDFDES